jgi:hypothetical protein
MPAHRFGIVVVSAALGALFAAAGGCSSDPTSSSGGAASSSTSSEAMTSSSTAGTGGATSTAASTTGSGSSSGSSSASSSSGGAGPGHCKKGCAKPLDCCPQGMVGCPSNIYPNNFTCDKGVCGSPQCSVKADCTFGGQLPQYDCAVIGGFHACIEPCTLDADCGNPSKCIGVDDSMKKYCKVDMGPACAVPADCAGFGQCVMGDCVCTGNADCTDPSANVCAN